MQRQCQVCQTEQRRENGEVDWSQLDAFSLEELFLLHVPMLRICPHFLRNRLRCVRGSERRWLPTWKRRFVHGSCSVCFKGVGSVGRTELAQRINLFQRGSWAHLIHRACAVLRVRSFQQALTEEAGLAVCVANSGAMRRALVSPLRPRSATQ